MDDLLLHSGDVDAMPNPDAAAAEWRRNRQHDLDEAERQQKNPGDFGFLSARVRRDTTVCVCVFQHVCPFVYCRIDAW